ncbi:hypothetical protein HN51_058445 [Arachis hypogaea]
MAINNVATKLFLCIFFVASLSASTLDARGGIMYRTINDAIMFCIQGQCHFLPLVYTGRYDINT